MTPRIVREELWQKPEYPGMIVVTTNSWTKKNNALVMGRGAAQQARDRIRLIDREAGCLVQLFEQRHGHRDYGFLVVRDPYREGLVGFGIFQVKRFYGDPGDLGLIELAVQKLSAWATEHPDVNIRMNYPGIGYGRLGRDLVEPLLDVLPQNVTICWR